MRLKLYADDILAVDTYNMDSEESRQALKRILPLRCPRCKGTTYIDGSPLLGWPCDECPDSPGFIYPDPPDWYETSMYANLIEGIGWHGVCRLVWRAMGIWED